MSISPAVVVRKHGFFSSIVRGVFGTVIVVLLCGTALSLYGMRMADKHVGTFLQHVVSNWPHWQEALPPQLADALNDRRAPEYRESVAVSAEVASERRGRDGQVVVVEVANKGDETISLLALRVVVESDKGVPEQEYTLYAATPVAIEDEWRGPIMPGSTPRRIAKRLCSLPENAKVTVETTDLRVTNPPETRPQTPPPMALRLRHEVPPVVELAPEPPPAEASGRE